MLRVSEKPLSILGQTLIQLLDQELQEVLQRKAPLRPSLAKLVLTLVTLNGALFKKHELDKLNPLLDTMRRVIVEADAKSRRGKAYLMLALDLYYANFTTLAMVSLQKVYGVYLDETQPAVSAHVDPFAEEEEEAPQAKDAATNTSRTSHQDHDQHVPEKRQRVEMAVQTEVAICDVFRAGPVVMTPVERASVATTCTNLSISRDDYSSSKAATTNTTTTTNTNTPPSPSATNSSGTRKSKIDPRIRNVRIGRVYPKPTSMSNGGTLITTVNPPRALSFGGSSSGAAGAATATSAMENGHSEVAKLSIKNVTLHELAMMKENPSHLNRITNGYLDRLAPPSEIRCPSIKSSSEYTGKENESESVSGRMNGGSSSGGGGSKKTSPIATGAVRESASQRNATNNNGSQNKFQMEENFDTITYDPSFFDDYVPHNGHASSKSFLQFLENK